MSESLASMLAARNALVGVVGLGYVGLPLVRAFVGSRVSRPGLRRRRREGRAGSRAAESYIEHIPSEVDRRTASPAERFEPTADMAALGEADAILICVPTPLTPAAIPT